MTKIIFEQFKVGDMDNFNYIIGDLKEKVAAVVDPSWEAEKILATAKKHGLIITTVLLTHTHYDHIDAVQKIVDATDAIVYVHESELSAVKNCANIIAISKEGIISIGSIQIKIIFTPGHTTGGITYNVENRLITGDTLFVGCCGRTDLPGGNAQVLQESLKKLMKFPEDYIIYPGHDYGKTKFSTVGYEKKNNPCIHL